MYIQNTSIKYDFINTYTYISFYQCMKNKLPFQVLFHYVIHGFREFTKEMCFALEAEFTNNALHELRRIRVFNCQMRLITNVCRLAFFPLDSYFFLCQWSYSLSSQLVTLFCHMQTEFLRLIPLLKLPLGTFTSFRRTS